jgi:hypothetical protein
MGWTSQGGVPQTAPLQPVRLFIAGLGVEVEAAEQDLRAAVQDRYQAYLGSGPIQIHLAISCHPDPQVKHTLEPKAEFFEGGVRFWEPAFQGEIDRISGRAQVRLTAPDPLPELEYFLRVIFALLAFESGGLLFHSAGVLRRGQAYLFFGPSGTGKTTVSRSVAASKVLNDDLVLLLPDKRDWTVYATPFWNPSQVVPAGPQRGPLAGLYRLVQSQSSFVEPMGRGQAVAELVANTPIIAANPSQGLALLNRAERLAQAVPPQRLHLHLGDNIWPVILGE